MKLGLVTKLDKTNTAKSKKFEYDVMSANCDVSVFFRFMVNLQSPGSRILDVLSTKLKFSLTITFYLTKTGNETKTSLTQLSYYCIE